MSLLLRRRVATAAFDPFKKDPPDNPVLIVSSRRKYNDVDRLSGIYAFGWDVTEQRHHYHFGSEWGDSQGYRYNSSAQHFLTGNNYSHRTNLEYRPSAGEFTGETNIQMRTALSRSKNLVFTAGSVGGGGRRRIYTVEFGDEPGNVVVETFYTFAENTECYILACNPFDDNILGVLTNNADGDRYLQLFDIDAGTIIRTYDVPHTVVTTPIVFRNDEEVYVVRSTSAPSVAKNYVSDTDVEWDNLRGVNVVDTNPAGTLLAAGRASADGHYSIYNLATKSMFGSLPAVSGTGGRTVKWIDNSNLAIGCSTSEYENGLFQFDLWNFELVSHTNYVGSVYAIDCPLPPDPPSSPPVDHDGIYASSDFLTMDMIN